MRPGTALERLHRVLIGAGIALAVVFGVYQFDRYTKGIEGALGWVAACIVLAVGLTGYLVWFNKKTKKRSPP